jgi:hypothetical protein
MNKYKKFNVLWNKQEEYSLDEFSFLRSFIKNKNIRVSYGFYNKISSKKMQIALIFDLIPFQNRKTGVENNWEIISQRQITDLEIDEFINHYFRKSFKRFLVFYYKDLEKLIIDDRKLGAETPYEFIKLCEIKGYKGKYQTRIEFNN